MTLAFTIGQSGMVITGVPRKSLTRGQVATHVGVVPSAAADMPAGIVMDDKPTDNAPLMCDLASFGCIVEDTDLNMDVETDLVWSNDDGTYSTSEPTGATTVKHWLLGVPISPTKFKIVIQAVSKGAA